MAAMSEFDDATHLNDDGAGEIRLQPGGRGLPEPLRGRGAEAGEVLGEVVG